MRGEAPRDSRAFSALRLPLFYLEAKASWLWSANLGRRRVARTEALVSPSPGGGGSRTAGARGGVRGDAGISSALRALSPHPAALRASTFPLQGKVEGALDAELRCRCRTAKGD